MIEAFASYKKVQYFNDRAVRLENIEIEDSKIQLTLSLIDFFDFLIINIVPEQLEGFVQYLKEKDIYYELCDEIECLGQYHKDMLQVNDFTSLITEGHSSNALAISVLLTDEKGDYLLTRRGLKTGISEMMHSVTATGAIGEEDYHSMDIIKNCVIRELKEELNLQVDLMIKEIIIVKQKYQPVVLLEGRVDKKFEELKTIIKCGKDYNDENMSLYAVPNKKLKGVARKYKFTDTSTYQLVGKCNSVGWFFYPKRDIRKYEI